MSILYEKDIQDLFFDNRLEILAFKKVNDIEKYVNRAITLGSEKVLRINKHIAAVRTSNKCFVFSDETIVLLEDGDDINLGIEYDFKLVDNYDRAFINHVLECYFYVNVLDLSGVNLRHSKNIFPSNLIVLDKVIGDFTGLGNKKVFRSLGIKAILNVLNDCTSSTSTSKGLIPERLLTSCELQGNNEDKVLDLNAFNFKTGDSIFLSFSGGSHTPDDYTIKLSNKSLSHLSINNFQNGIVKLDEVQASLRIDDFSFNCKFYITNSKVEVLDLASLFPASRSFADFSNTAIKVRRVSGDALDISIRNAFELNLCGTQLVNEDDILHFMPPEFLKKQQSKVDVTIKYNDKTNKLLLNILKKRLNGAIFIKA